MLNRWIGIACLAAMLSGNTALLLRDILPEWLAGDPPPPWVRELDSGQVLRRQTGIFDGRGQRIGCNWCLASRTGSLLLVRSVSLLHSLPLPRELRTPALRVVMELTFQENAALDRLRLSVDGLGVPLCLEGEHVPPHEFPCRWHAGAQEGQFVLDARSLRALGDVIRPFDDLRDLYVGRTWRHELFNPLTHLAAGLGGPRISTRSLLVRVTAQETLSHAGRAQRVHRVEADGITAWVALDGRVLRQEVELPVIGRLCLVDEPFDERACAEATGRTQR